VVVLGAHGEVVFVAAHELGERAGHGEGQGLHVAHLLPEAGLGPLVAGLLVGKQLVGGDDGVRGQVQVHVPAEHDAVGHPRDLEGWSGGQQLP